MALPVLGEPCSGGNDCSGSFCSELADGGGICAAWLPVTASCNANANFGSGCWDDYCAGEPDGGGYCVVPACD